MKLTESELVGFRQLATSGFTTMPEDKDDAGIDIFRLDGHGEIVEHRDVLQVIPEQSVNQNSMF